MSGVLPFEQIVAPQRHGRVRPWSTGTLTHAFPGGYLQVTHHDNHSHATGRGCTVTMSVDAGEDPDATFARLLEELPDLRAQFARARRTRPWEDAAPPAASEPGVLALPRLVDPLLSQELTVGLELANAAAEAILSGEPEAAVARRDALLAHHERLVRAWHGATRSFAMVNAFLRFWLLGSILQALALKRARLDRDWAAMNRGGPYWFRVPARLPEIVDASLADIESAIARRVPDGVAAERIFARLRREKIVPPLYDFGDPDARIYRFTPARRVRMLVWATLIAPKDFRRLLTQENVSGDRRHART
jgi:FADH2 O2-dependent halogenase